jgi:hypothetical protein
MGVEMAKTDPKDPRPKKPKAASVVWADAPAEHDYPAARSYLGLLAGPELVDACTDSMSRVVTVWQHAKDILRAARLPLLGADNHEVAKDLGKVAAGEALAPVLLVRGDLVTGRVLQIADGYHRVCASYHLSEDTLIPCRLVSLPAGDDPH